MKKIRKIRILDLWLRGNIIRTAPCWVDPLTLKVRGTPSIK